MSMNILYSTQIFGITINKYQGNLLELVYPDDFEITVEMVIAIDKLMLDITQGAKFGLISNFKDSYGTMTQEAQIHFAEKINTARQITGNAIIINNLPMRMMVNFYLRFKRPVYPSKSFTNTKEATNWITACMGCTDKRCLSA